MNKNILIYLFTVLTVMVFTISSADAQHTASISVHKPVQPVFIGETHNPVLKLEILTRQTDLELNGIELKFGESTAELIENVQLFYTAISMNQLLEEGRNYVWVSVELNDQVTLTDLLEIDTSTLLLNEKEYTAESDRPHTALKPAKKIRKADQDGVHTYRIPGMVTSSNGTLLAVYDVRRDNSGDLQGDIDVGLSRSTDGGETWEPMKIIMDRGSGYSGRS